MYKTFFFYKIDEINFIEFQQMLNLNVFIALHQPEEDFLNLHHLILTRKLYNY